MKRNKIISKSSEKVILYLIITFIVVLIAQIVSREFIIYDFYKSSQYEIVEIEDNEYYIAAMASMKSVEDTIDRINVCTLFIVIIISIITIIVLLRQNKKFASSIVELKTVIEKIAKLDFNYTANTYSKGDIGELTENIEKMSKSIEINLKILKRKLRRQDSINKYQRNFLNNISHELKTPLTILQGIAYGIDDGIYQLGDSYVTDTLHTQINRMEEFISQLLDIARLNLQDELNIEVFLLSDLVLKVNHNIKYLIEQKGIKLIMELDESVVSGDRNKIELVISNLYSNAIRYTPIGEVIIIIIKDGVFSIENTGVTILNKDINKIWEPFYKINSVKESINKKTGLGLYIVKQILESHKSEYSITSRDDSVIAKFKLKKINNNYRNRI